MLAALSALLAGGCSSEEAEQVSSREQLPPAAVSVVTVEEQAPARQVEIMGTVQAAESASIAARVSGNIIELPVSLGSRVSEGDLLVTLGAGEINAQLLQAQAQFEQAERTLARERRLLAKNAATAETVRTLEETRQIAAAALKEARTMLGYTTISAPFSGIITRKMASIGDLATPGKPLLQLENEGQLQVLADVPESLVLALSIGDELPIHLPAAGLQITGRIIEIAPTADPRSRTAPIKLAIESSAQIRSGQFARISLPSGTGAAFMVPEDAVLPFGQMERIFLTDGQRARLQLVKTGLRHDGAVEILAGVTVGDRVIVSGHRHLQDGQPVTIN
ncbi:MAG: efflux RND transporter periplasmic adaptor subunit [Desulfofustis sp.]|nr:efflux RND transporter periplasmic adaptor subunit [Desulfofustis sp.]